MTVIHPSITSKIESGNQKEILEAVEVLISEGQADCLPTLINLLHNTIDEQVITAVNSMLRQLKQQDAVPYLIEAIADENFHDIREKLLIACWENGLSYVKYIDVLIDIMIAADFMSAFEVHTLITNMWGKITEDQLAVEEQKITDALLNVNAEKAVLLQEVKEYLHVLEEGVEPAEY
ncbi:MAG: HEAT repeat domain-containing protein [Mangrovibacterium sp.]